MSCGLMRSVGIVLMGFGARCLEILGAGWAFGAGLELPAVKYKTSV